MDAPPANMPSLEETKIGILTIQCLSVNSEHFVGRGGKRAAVKGEIEYTGEVKNFRLKGVGGRLGPGKFSVGTHISKTESRRYLT